MPEKFNYYLRQRKATKRRKNIKVLKVGIKA
jgi:hypothetical protein